MGNDGDRTQRWKVRQLERSDHEAWVALFTGYATFYERALTASQLEMVWRWIFEDETMIALVVVDRDLAGRPIGLAHLRSWRRPLRASVNGYLDDLFVAPENRGTGAVDALFTAMRELAVEQGWEVIRWTTAEDNHRAQTVYDRYATRTSWVTYDENC